MHDPTIHARTIARHVKKSDFAHDGSLYDPANLGSIIADAVTKGTTGFQQLSLKQSLLRGKAVYQPTNLADALVLRHITRNIRRVTSVKQDDRQFIVRSITNLCADGLPFRVYKFDIASFYESVMPNHVLSHLDKDVAFSGQSVRALRSFFDQLDASQIPGLPRGLALSATLAEYLLRSLDRFVSNSMGVWFYARFVDDIFIITDGGEDATEFSNLLASKLPAGLTFNNKSGHHTFTPFPGGGGPPVLEHQFDFLGYRFFVTRAYRDQGDQKIKRDVWLDIAPKKVRRLKTRLAKSLLAYRTTGDFDVLLDRLRLLTSNFRFVDGKTGATRSAGIYFNYPLVNADQSTALPALDRFLSRALVVPHPGNRLRPTNLTKPQMRAAINLRFEDGFRDRRFFSFSSERLKQITSAWAYA